MFAALTGAVTDTAALRHFGPDLAEPNPPGSGLARVATRIAGRPTGSRMVHREALYRAISAYARTRVRSYEIGDVLYQLTDQSLDVTGADGAGVCVGDAAGPLQFVTASDDRTMRAERAQVSGAEGPCHQAHLTGRVVTSEDLSSEARWPGFTAAVLEIGWRAVAGIPMAIEGAKVGALDLYMARPHRWSAEELESARLLADVATGYILNTRELKESKRLAEQLQAALDSRVVIEQATGVLVERHAIPASAAFLVMRKRARSLNVKLHDLAREIVDGAGEIPSDEVDT